MKKINFLILTSLLVLSSATVSAQILYNGQGISVNYAPTTYYNFAAADWTGMYLTYGQNRFFQLDIVPTSPRLAGSNNQIVLYNTQTSTFNTLQCSNVFTQSDARSKENICSLSSGLNTILRLRPVSYNWKKAPSVKSDEKADGVAYGPAEESQTQYGFLAQEVEEILPDVVKTNDDGYKLINYTAIIPMLVKAVQELQATVEAQALQIEQLTGSRSRSAEQSSLGKITSCTPNPSDGIVTISTELGSDVTTATLAISSLSGNRERTLAVSPSNTQISEDISSLTTGIHIVSLLVNGVPVDSQRLIKE